MNDAVKYFQKNGLQRSKELVGMGFGFCSLEDSLSFHTDQLKQLVKSHELVKSRGGLDAAKHELILLQKHLNNTFGYVTIITSEKIENLKQAIADVESCMGVSSESN